VRIQLKSLHFGFAFSDVTSSTGLVESCAGVPAVRQPYRSLLETKALVEFELALWRFFLLLLSFSILIIYISALLLCYTDGNSSARRASSGYDFASFNVSFQDCLTNSSGMTT